MSNLSGFVKNLRDIMRNDPGINGDAQRIEQIAWLLFLKVYDSREKDWDFDDGFYESIIPENCRWGSWAGKNGPTASNLLDFVNNTLFPTLKNLPIREDSSLKQSIVRAAFEDVNNYMKDGVLLRQLISVIDELNFEDYGEIHAFAEIYETILKELQSAGSAGEFYTPRAVTDFMAKMIRPKVGDKMADLACGTGGFLTSWLNELTSQTQKPEDVNAVNNSIYGVKKKQFPYILCLTNLLLHRLDAPEIHRGNSLTKDYFNYPSEGEFDVILMNPPYGGSEKDSIKQHFPADLASSETADLFMALILRRLKKDVGRAAVVLPDGFLFGADNAKINLKKKLISEFNLHTIIRLPGSVFAPYTSITTNLLFFDRTEPTGETWFYRLDMPEGYKHFSKTKPMLLKHFDPVIEWWNDRREISVDGFDKAKRYTSQELIDRNYNLDLCGFPHQEEEILPPKDLILQYQEKRAALNADIDRILAEISSILEIDKEDLSETESQEEEE